MRRYAALLLLTAAACAPYTSITVDVEDVDQIAMVEVVDQATWSGEADDGHYDSAEDAALPVTFEVPAGDYTVVIAQGNCNTTADVTVTQDEAVDVTLALDCSE